MYGEVEPSARRHAHCEKMSAVKRLIFLLGGSTLVGLPAFVRNGHAAYKMLTFHPRLVVCNARNSKCLRSSMSLLEAKVWRG